MKDNPNHTSSEDVVSLINHANTNNINYNLQFFTINQIILQT